MPKGHERLDRGRELLGAAVVGLEADEEQRGHDLAAHGDRVAGAAVERLVQAPNDAADLPVAGVVGQVHRALVEDVMHAGHAGRALGRGRRAHVRGAVGVLVRRRRDPDLRHHALRADRVAPVVLVQDVSLGLIRRPREVLARLDVNRQRGTDAIADGLGDGAEAAVLAAPGIDGEGVSPGRADPRVAWVRHDAPGPGVRADAEDCAAGHRDPLRRLGGLPQLRRIHCGVRERARGRLGQTKEVGQLRRGVGPGLGVGIVRQAVDRPGKDVIVPGLTHRVAFLASQPEQSEQLQRPGCSCRMHPGKREGGERPCAAPLRCIGRSPDVAEGGNDLVSVLRGVPRVAEAIRDVAASVVRAAE